MKVPLKNIFENIPVNIPEELTEVVIETDKIRIERIVSRAHSSPPDFWYDQEGNEYVILLKGKAGLAFENSNSPIVLKPGDYLNIPAHVRHRLDWTSPEEDTIWLVIHY
jgi:cupin 2 domain-containing protein